MALPRGCGSQGSVRHSQQPSCSQPQERWVKPPQARAAEEVSQTDGISRKVRRKICLQNILTPKAHPYEAQATVWPQVPGLRSCFLGR